MGAAEQRQAWERVNAAHELREQGTGWAEVAEKLGWPTAKVAATAFFQYRQRHGEPPWDPPAPPPRPAPPREATVVRQAREATRLAEAEPGHCPACGERAAPNLYAPYCGRVHWRNKQRGKVFSPLPTVDTGLATGTKHR